MFLIVLSGYLDIYPGSVKVGITSLELRNIPHKFRSFIIIIDDSSQLIIDDDKNGGNV